MRVVMLLVKSRIALTGYEVAIFATRVVGILVLLIKCYGGGATCDVAGRIKRYTIV